MKLEKIPTNLKSVDFWLEVLVNGLGSILLPSNIKFPRIEKKSKAVNERFHEANIKRYAMMHVTILIENCVLAFWSWQSLSQNNDTTFTTYYPCIVLGIFLLSLLCQIMYYQLHAWPIKVTAYFSSQLCSLKKQNAIETGEDIELIPKEKDFSDMKGKNRI